MPPVEEFIIQQNIQRFERLLAQTEDACRRDALVALLAAEQRKLVALSAARSSGATGALGPLKDSGD